MRTCDNCKHFRRIKPNSHYGRCVGVRSSARFNVTFHESHFCAAHRFGVGYYIQQVLKWIKTKDKA